ncbi:putative ABC transporter permease [Candidatus Saccharibacteria bacterium]|nr:putative ABC transporter permease [Candidatus Saccharibacteria bacterium]
MSKAQKNIKKTNKRQFFKRYLNDEVRLKTYQKVGVMMLVVVIAGFIGWVWEFALAEIAGRFQHLYIKGGNLLPWMNIYAYGAVAIILVSCTLKKYPWAVFVASALVCGVLEWFAGWVVYTVGNGTRYWDYSHSWFGLGNIDGFVCPASVIAFGLGALALMYWLLPKCMLWSQVMSRRAFLTLAITLFVVVLTDDIVNLTLKNLGLPTAHNFYQALGWVYKS